MDVGTFPSSSRVKTIYFEQQFMTSQTHLELSPPPRPPTSSFLFVLRFRPQGDLIPLLVSHGADPEVRDAEGLRPIHVAAMNGQHIPLLALLTAGADPWSVTPRAWNALHYSVAGGFSHTTRLLAYWDSDSGIFGRQQNSAGVTASALGRCRKERQSG